MSPEPVLQSQRHQVSAAEAGSRLDVFLASRLSLSRIQTRRLLARGTVAVDGRYAGERDKGKLLAEGAVVEVAGFTAPAAMRVVPEADAPLTIAAQGDGWIVVDKPAGVPVHPLVEGETGTVLNALAARFPQVHGVGEGGLRSGVVHRLDVDTSGVLLFATTQEKWEELREVFERRGKKSDDPHPGPLPKRGEGGSLLKLYRCIVVGRLTGHGREVANLVVARHKPAKVRVVEDTGRGLPSGSRRCDLAWKALEVFDDATLVEVSLGTGFLHQIRVMLAHLGHPVIGDKLYGSAVDAPRPMLHAVEIEIAPIHGRSDDPPDFAACLAMLRGKGA